MNTGAVIAPAGPVMCSGGITATLMRMGGVLMSNPAMAIANAAMAADRALVLALAAVAGN